MSIPKPDIATYPASDFAQWHETGQLVMTPRFQRREVWTVPKKSFLIDSILRGIPIPPIMLRSTITKKGGKTLTGREVIDGQQRIHSILQYINGEYRLSRTLEDAPWAGRFFSKLDADQQEAINQYPIFCMTFPGLGDEEVLDIFSRLNIYSAQLTKQELRNGQFFGHFKQTVYKLSADYLGFWRENKILSERNIARMQEAELTSELMIAQIAGMQDKKKSINGYYKEFDDEFPGRDVIFKRFRLTIEAISESCAEVLSKTAFHRPPLFYTLYCVVYHRMFGLHGQKQRTPKKGTLKEEDGTHLSDALLNLSQIITDHEEEEDGESGRDGKHKKFVAACSRQTDNIQPRQIRFASLYEAAFGD
jgi:hypothetical protein